MEFLILILAPLGDTLFATPALKALRNSYPDAEIDVITWEESKDILIDNPNINRLIICKGKGQLISELQNLRVKVYDFAIGLSTIGSYISYLVNARKKLGFKSEELGWIYDFNLPDNRDIHAVEYCLEIVKTLGARPDPEPRLELPINNNNRCFVAKRLKIMEINSNLPLLAIHPGGKYFTFKRWPLVKFNKLIKIIDQKFDLEIVLIGGKDDKRLVEKIIDPFYNYKHRPKNLVGELKIKETGALLEKADLFIGNDSGPLHMAAAVKTPVIALFGPTNPVNFYPYGTEFKIYRCDLPCSPCFSWLGNLKQYLPEYLPEWATKCKAKCMDEIKVEELVKGIKSFLEKKSGVYNSGSKFVSGGNFK